jgi:hypothetical protein
MRFDEDCRKLAKLAQIPGYKECHPQQDVKAIVKEWLEGDSSGDWILVLDNADDKLNFFPNNEQSNTHTALAMYIPTATKGTVAITTRDFEVARQLAGPKGVLKKEAMNSTDAAELFALHYPSGVTNNDNDYIDLLEELKFLPLAVTQVASYLEMNRNMISSAQYLATFQRTKEDKKRLLSKAVHNVWRLDISSVETVLTTFIITFRPN